MNTNFRIRNKIRFIFPYFLFLSLIMIALRKILFTPGIIGFTWDWDIPPFPGQILTKMQMFFYAWLDIPTLGMTAKITSPFYYWLLVAPFGFFGGAVLVKVALVFLLLLAGISMLVLCRRLGFNLYLSLIPSVFYMFSPVMYSRIIAGHPPIAFGYALLPLFATFLLKSFDYHRFRQIHIILAGILFSLVSGHPMLMGCVFVVLSLFSLIEFFSTDKKLYVFRVFLTILGIFVLLHSFWLIPFAIKYIQGEQIAHGGMTYALGKISLQAESPLMMAYLRSCSIPPIDSLRLLARQGMDVEFVFPTKGMPPFLWALVSFSIPVLVFFTLFLKRKERDKRYFSFILLALLGITLVSGVKTPIGSFIYYQILYRLGWVFAEFSNANRWNPLIALAYAPLLGYFFQWAFRKPLRKGIIILSLIAVSLYLYPFWSGNLSRRVLPGSQPHSLLVTEINPQDKEVYDFLKNDPEDFRVSYLPPAGLSYVGVPKLSYEWTSLYSPKPEFMAHSYAGEPFSQFCVTTLFQRRLKSQYLGKLLGLASVKYIVFPKYDVYYLYQPIDRLEFAGLREAAYLSENRLENTLKFQKDILKSAKLKHLDTIELFENENWLPHIYPLSDLALASGDFSTLVSASFLPSLKFDQTGLIFSSPLTKEENQEWQPLVNRYVFYNNNYLDFLLPFLPEQYKIYPGYFVPGETDANMGWVNLGFWWYYDWHHSTSLVKPNGVYTRIPSSCQISYSAEKEDNYEIYTLLHKGPLASKLTFTLDEEPIGEVITKAKSDLGFKWIHLTTLKLSPGERTLEIKSDKGENAILEMVVVPQNIMEEAQADFRSQLKEKEILLLNEMEEFKETELDHAASRGEAVSLPAKGRLYAPKKGNYKILLRAKASKEAILQAVINKEKKEILLKPSGKSYRWYSLERVYLKEGMNNFSFFSQAENIKLDLLSAELYSLGAVLTEPEKFQAIKISPTRYEIQVKTASPFFFFFSEKHHPKWQARLDQKVAPHILGYGFGNFYYINKIGDYTITLGFVDQKYFTMGQFVTLSSWILLFSTLLILYIRGKKCF